MRRWAVVLSAVTISLGAASAVTGATANADNPNDPYTLSNGHADAGPASGVVNARGDAHSSRPRGGSTPNLAYHGGPVQHSTTVEPIYWGTSWASDTEGKVVGLQTLYQGLTGSGYAGTNGEYYDGTGADNPAVNYQAAIFDPSAAPTSAPSTSTIANEVLHALSLNHQSLNANWYYPVYIDQPRGSAGYCAWHSAATVRSTGTEFQFGFFFNLDNDNGCDVSDSYHNVGLASLGNVTGHEYSEMVTDPQLNAWYDSQGSENADKCAWHFSGLAVKLGGTNWTIQGNWSNAAYTAKSGYYNYGCIDGNQ